jgi:excinuclease UvrABC nuclease subunit
VSRPVTFEFTPIRAGGAPGGEGIRIELPARSGVFRIFDVHGNLILLDKTFHLAQRIERFFVNDADRRDLDLREISGRIEYCRTDSPFESLYLLHDQRRQWFPSSYRRMKTFPLVRLLEIDPGLRFPRLEAVRRAVPGRWTFGPFRSRNELEKLKSDMERTFRLRPCEYDIRGDDPYPDCIYFQMHTCSKPCNGDIDRAGYMDDIARAAAFIEGREGAVLAAIEEQIRALSDDLRFEQAASLQKRVELITEARRAYRHLPYRVEKFDAVVVLDSGSARTRKIAFVRGGKIEGIEEHDIAGIDQSLGKSIGDRMGDGANSGSPDRIYEDFCLVSRFMTHPVGSVHVVPYTAAGDAVNAVVKRIEDARTRKRSPRNRNETTTPDA